MIKAQIQESNQDPKKKVISIEVADEGIGISKEDLPNLLTPFFRSSNEQSREKNPNGNGLGLSICHNIAKSLQGDLICKSEFGRGSIFTFSFLSEFSKPERILQSKKVKKKPKPKHRSNQKLDIIIEELYGESSSV